MEIISEEKMSLKKTAQILDEAYLEVVKTDGDKLIVDVGGCKVLVFFDDEKKIISFVSIWGFESGSEIQRLKLANQLNDELILVRFHVNEGSSALWCDQQILVKGGISAKWLVLSLKRFGEVCSGAVKMHPDFF